jgi:DNA polymerase III delta subunit
MTIDAVLSSLRSGKVPPVLVLSGDEGWFIDEAVRLAREKFLSGVSEGYQPASGPRRSGDPEGLVLSAALEEARTLPMFATKKLVHWRAGTLSGEDVTALTKYATKPPSFARVIVEVGELGKAAETALGEAGVAVASCRRLFDTPWPGRPEWDTPLDKWTAARAREVGLSLNVRIAHVLTSIVGNDLRLIDSALSVLSASGRPADEEAVRELLGGSREYSIFSFGDAVYDSDAALAHRIAKNLFLEGTEDERGRLQREAGHVGNRLVWAVWFRLNQVYAAARLREAGRTDAEVVAELGGKPAAKRAVAQARATGTSVLLRHFKLVAEAWAALRSVASERAVVDGLISRLTERERPVRREGAER